MSDFLRRTLEHFKSNLQNKQAFALSLRARYSSAIARFPNSPECEELKRLSADLEEKLALLNKFMSVEWENEGALIGQLEMHEVRALEVTKMMKSMEKIMTELVTFSINSDVDSLLQYTSPLETILRKYYSKQK